MVTAKVDAREAVAQFPDDPDEPELLDETEIDADEAAAEDLAAPEETEV